MPQIYNALLIGRVMDSPLHIIGQARGPVPTIQRRANRSGYARPLTRRTGQASKDKCYCRGDPTGRPRVINRASHRLAPTFYWAGLRLALRIWTCMQNSYMKTAGQARRLNDRHECLFCAVGAALLPRVLYYPAGVPGLPDGRTRRSAPQGHHAFRRGASGNVAAWAFCL